MPPLLNVLRNADGPEYKKLGVKAMECAGLIGWFQSLYQTQSFLMYPLHPAIAVGRDIFRPDANMLVELMMQIQSTFFSTIDENVSDVYAIQRGL